jgi:N-acetylglutamate synthase-like GNAT family acetyltransferase
MNYKYIKGYQADTSLLRSYHKFTQQVFGFDLIAWKNAGCWCEKYIPHSLVDNDRIIANISASIMHLQIREKDVAAIQLGSVGVLPEFRGKGLSRILMEKVLAEYKQCPLLFLFANNKVLDYYPKFGFSRVNEGAPQIAVADCHVQRKNAVKININATCLRRLLAGNLMHSAIIDARGNLSIYLFHLLYFYKENIYYIEDKDIVFIAQYHGEGVNIIDILSRQPIHLDEILGYLLINETKRVYFSFTPDWLIENYEVTANQDDIMYVLGNLPRDLADFKFPITAHT